MQSRAMALLAGAALGLMGASGAAHAEFGESKPMEFKSPSARLAQISAENMRITAENVSIQQRFLIESVQRGQIINNLILVNQIGDGSIRLNATQSNIGDHNISNTIRGRNDIRGSIGY